ncbi:MFS transporter [Nocardia sp. alder85J]|uniref:MFS transporter n=1 Tax=Nocardia sp. alder85J TaxID=2862949 RepID=UPI001CD39097|nr:MFS transporter [Nocardia sp. alder85J]MCX4093875.1 MFS transporter [Nocardia sp. alder85J]
MTGAAAARHVLPDSVEPGARRRFHLVVLVAGVGFGLTAPFTALLVVGLGGSPEWAAVVVSSIGLSLLLVDFVGTRFVPRVPSRTALTVSLLVFGAGCLLSAATGSWEVVGIARVLQGFGSALFLGGGVALAIRLVGSETRGRAIGTFNAFWFLGVATGPLGGGLIATVAPGPDGLRWLFAVCGVVNLVGAVAAWYLTPRWVSPQPPRFGLPSGLGVRGRRMWSALVLAGLGQAVRSGLALTLVPLLGDKLGMSWIALGAGLFALALTDIGTMHFGGGLSDRFGRQLPLALALAWGTVAVGVLAIVVHSPAGFFVGALATGVTVGATWVVPAAMTIDLAENPEGALAVYRIACDIGMLAGGLFAAAGIAAGGVRAALAATSVLLFGGLLLTLTVRETLPRPSRPILLKEKIMPLPPPEEFAVLATNSDITLTPERFAQAYATHVRYRAELERLRAIPLPFVETVSEPATALAWIEDGGKP